MNAAADLHVDVELVRRLLGDQHPDLADLPLAEAANGWDNVMYRLGDDLAVRVPRREVAAHLVRHEQEWLPRLASALPLAIPVPQRVGLPSERFPFPWSVLPWLVGRPAWAAPPDDLLLAADDLGAFLRALHVPAPDDAPVNEVRGVPLAQRATALAGRLSALADVVPVRRVERAWRRALDVPVHAGPPVWLHGDLHPANLLTDRGRLSAVIDFGDLTAGDPATDLSIAWMLFDTDSRARFRDSVGADDDTWRRGAGWALLLSIAYLAGSPAGSPMIPIGHVTLEHALDELG